jgi:transposase
LYGQLQKRIEQLDRQVEEQAKQRSQARRLLTHPGVGPVTALATEVFLGDPKRFAYGDRAINKVGRHVGLNFYDLLIKGVYAQNRSVMSDFSPN